MRGGDYGAKKNCGDGRHRSGLFYGGIVAADRDGAVLDTATELNVFDNIQLEAGGKLFGKVMERTEAGFLLRFTSIPAGYEAWMKRAEDSAGQDESRASKAKE